MQNGVFETFNRRLRDGRLDGLTPTEFAEEPPCDPATARRLGDGVCISIFKRH